MQADADLYLLGAGIAFPDHLTIQTIEILGRCKEIHTNLAEDQLVALPADIREKCVSLANLYRDGRERRDNYKKVTEAVVERMNSVRPLAWLTPGHPLIFDSVSQALMAAAEEHGWVAQAVPGISSIDTVLAEVGYDAAHGLIVYEAYELVKQNVVVSPSFAALLLQPGAFGSSVAHLSGAWHPDLAPLRDHIRTFRDPDHECAFVWSSRSRFGRDKVWWSRVDEMESVPTEALGNSTLFVPPVGAALPKTSR
jgi:hypothetical protein